MKQKIRLEQLEEVYNLYPSKIAKRKYEEYPDLVGYFYAVQDAKMFLNYPNAREARGIVFDKRTGNPVIRPFHKFFNFHELPNTEEYLKKSALYGEKYDGSLLAVTYNDEYGLLVSTRTGNINRGGPFEEWMNLPSGYRKEIEGFARANHEYTHLFEIVSPTSRIVINYDEGAAVYLMSRNLISGEYKIFEYDLPYKVEWFSTNDAEQLQNLILNRENTEGVVFFYPDDNELFKQKTLWYLKLHKGISVTAGDVIDMWINDELDDLLAIVRELKKERMEKEILSLVEDLNGYLRRTIEFKDLASKLGLPVDNRGEAARRINAFLNDQPSDEAWPVLRKIIFAANINKYTEGEEAVAKMLEEKFRESVGLKRNPLRRLLVNKYKHIGFQLA